MSRHHHRPATITPVYQQRPAIIPPHCPVSSHRPASRNSPPSVAESQRHGIVPRRYYRLPVPRHCLKSDCPSLLVALLSHYPKPPSSRDCPTSATVQTVPRSRVRVPSFPRLSQPWPGPTAHSPTATTSPIPASSRYYPPSRASRDSPGLCCKCPVPGQCPAAASSASSSIVLLRHWASGPSPTIPKETSGPASSNRQLVQPGTDPRLSLKGVVPNSAHQLCGSCRNWNDLK